MLKQMALAILLASLAVPSVLDGQKVEIIDRSLRASPESYSGQCPTEIRFSVILRVLQAGRVTVDWLYSDEQAPHKETRYFNAGIYTLENKWPILESYRGWQVFRVVDPVKLESDYAYFTANCESRPKDKFRFVVFGDSQGEGALEEMTPRMEEWSPDFIVFVGDMATDSDLEDNWWAWHFHMSRFTDRGIPIYNVAGNHDLVGNPIFSPSREDWLGGQQRYQRIFADLPANGPPGYEHLAYSFEYGNSLFVILDSFYVKPRSGQAALYEVSQEQLRWFQDTAARSSKVHRFAFAHVPASFVNQARVNRPLVDWLIKNDFDAFFAGHEHFYARRSLGEGMHPVQIITGGLSGDIAKPVEGLPRPEAFSPKRHFVIVDVDGDEVIIQAVDKDGKLIDYKYRFRQEKPKN